jgi:hypothetical protein
MKMRPREGNGERFLDCRYYNECLDVAGIQNWKGFDCEACDFYLIIHKGPDALIEAKVGPTNKNATDDGMTTVEKPENTRICEECGEKPTISAKHAFCGSCLSKKSWSNGSRNKRHVKRKQKATPKKIKSKKPSPHCKDTLITVNFQRYPSILKGIQEMAEEEVRPLDLQIVYLLKRSLKPG